VPGHPGANRTRATPAASSIHGRMEWLLLAGFVAIVVAEVAFLAIMEWRYRRAADRD
jgi:hypothetical protein